jgi:hypothetical protein
MTALEVVWEGVTAAKHAGMRNTGSTACVVTWMYTKAFVGEWCCGLGKSARLAWYTVSEVV